MSVLRWPDTLPQRPLLAGYGIGIDDGVIETEVAAGEPIYRARTSVVPSVVTVEWLMDDFQYSLFDYWVRNTVQGKLREFYIVLPTSAGNSEKLARMLNFGASTEGLWWRVVATLSVRKLDLLAEETAEVLLSQGGFSGLEQSINRAATAVQEMQALI